MNNPYPSIIVDESSGVKVSNDNHYVWEDGFKAGESTEPS